jgi:predicted transcriptional regulator
METKVKCLECNKKFKFITHTHLKKHNLTVNEYRKN